ncbi:MAG TPA: hypothetical protein VGH51_13680 [Candidatus Angelobacter sp.]
MPARAQVSLYRILFAVVKLPFGAEAPMHFVSSSAEYKSTPGSLHTAARNFRFARHLITILKRDFPEADL